MHPSWILVNKDQNGSISPLLYFPWQIILIPLSFTPYCVPGPNPGSGSTSPQEGLLPSLRTAALTSHTLSEKFKNENTTLSPLISNLQIIFDNPSYP